MQLLLLASRNATSKLLVQMNKKQHMLFSNTQMVQNLKNKYIQPSIQGRQLSQNLQQSFASRSDGGESFEERLQRQNALRQKRQKQIDEGNEEAIMSRSQIIRNNMINEKLGQSSEFSLMNVKVDGVKQPAGLGIVSDEGVEQKKSTKEQQKADKKRQKSRETYEEETNDDEEAKDFLKDKTAWTVELEQQVHDERRSRKSYATHDSIDDLVSFEDENTNNISAMNIEQQKQLKAKQLMEKIYKEDQDEKDNERDSNQNKDDQQQFEYLSQLFKTREKKLAFDLMNLNTAEQILQLYQNEQTRISNRDGSEDYLTADEECLFFYFVVSQNRQITDNQMFQQLLQSVLDKAEQLSVVSLQTFIWSLGQYIGQFGGIVIPQAIKKTLADHTLKLCRNFEDSQKVNLGFAIAQIFSDPQDSALAVPIISVFAQSAGSFMQALSQREIVTMIMTFMMVQFDDPSIISQFVERVVEIRKEFPDEDIEKICCALGELNYGNSKQFNLLISEIVAKEKGNQQPLMSANTASSLIFTLSGAQEKNEQLLRSLLRIVHCNYRELNITCYVNLWLALGRFKIDPTKYEQTFAILLKVLASSHVFSMGDLTCDEVIRLMAACSALQLNNKTLVNEFVKASSIRLRAMNPEQLVILARSSVIYVKQFEQFFVAIHNECLAKLNLLSYDQKLLLRKTFSRTRILFPDSPLIDTRL